MFEIRHPNGDPVSIGTLEVDARVAWDIPDETLYKPGEKKFASPLPEDIDKQHSWWHVIGHAIEHPRSATNPPRLQSSWGNVKETLFHIHVEDLWNVASMLEMHSIVSDALSYLTPYYELIDYWRSQGYVPVKLSSDGI